MMRYPLNHKQESRPEQWAAGETRDETKIFEHEKTRTYEVLNN